MKENSITETIAEYWECVNREFNGITGHVRKKEHYQIHRNIRHLFTVMGIIFHLT
jgi:hypothetical protein